MKTKCTIQNKNPPKIVCNSAYCVVGSKINSKFPPHFEPFLFWYGLPFSSRFCCLPPSVSFFSFAVYALALIACLGCLVQDSVRLQPLHMQIFKTYFKNPVCLTQEVCPPTLGSAK